MVSMKTMGMIGGTSWHSTIEYYRFINEITSERLGPAVNPNLLLYSLNVEIMHEGNWEKINQRYLELCIMLENAGAQGIIFCANTPHKVYPFVSQKIKIPIIHIADATGREAQQRDLSTLGLLGTLPTMEEDFISGRIKQRFGINSTLPEKEEREKLHQIIAYELTQGKFTNASKTFMIEEMEKLKEKGAEGIALACTELPMLVKPDDFDLPMLDTTWLHARAAVDFILS